MARVPRHLVAVLLSALVSLAGCAAPDAGDLRTAVAPVASAVQAEAAEVVAPAAGELQLTAAEVLVPAGLQLQAAVQDLLPPPEPSPSTWAGADVAAELIIRWEIGSPQRYARLYQGLICPPGASGPTGGVGYDFGHQTPAAIRVEWGNHPAVGRLATASGVTGQAACREWVSRHADIRIPYDVAHRIFIESTLPAYRLAAERALGEGWFRLPPPAQAGNTSMGYNRGWSMVGDRNREKREIRDTCAPAGDVRCNAAEIRSMKRLWPDIPGLQRRREDEARIVESVS